MNYKYFIERTDTEEWHYIKEEWQEGVMVHDGYMGLFPEWTNDPMTAKMWDKKEDAEGYLKHETIPHKELCVVTEHEFIHTKIPQSSQKNKNDLSPDVIKSVCDHEPVEPLNSCCFIYTCKKCGETYDTY